MKKILSLLLLSVIFLICMNKNLVLPLFISSLFFTSNVDSAVFDFYEQQNNNLLIAEGGCGGGGGGGMKPADKIKLKEKRKKAQDAAKKRLEKSKEAVKILVPIPKILILMNLKY